MMVLYMLTSETNVYACIDVFPQAASEISRMPSAKENIIIVQHMAVLCTCMRH